MVSEMSSMEFVSDSILENAINGIVKGEKFGNINRLKFKLGGCRET